jgi:hypothetical protein
VVEFNKGDVVHFTLKNGRTVDLKVLSYQTNLIFTTLEQLKKGNKGDGTIYSMSCKLKIDGQTMTLRRYVPVQNSFYEPYVVNGLRIWFDGLAELSEYFNENHGPCLPDKDVRFALQDASMPVSPEPLHNWCPLPRNNLNISDAYRGDDTWLGTYYGADLHGGLDINMPSNTPLWAPIDFDEHYYFNSLDAGHNNNRWRGVKRWDNGDTWFLRTHHMVELLKPAYNSIRQGEKYAYSAGVHAGYTPHTHFVFRVKQPGKPKYYMDPWVIFWQIFENNRNQQQEIRAHIEPVSPAHTGEPVHFSSAGSRTGIRGGNKLEYFWSFGDGMSSIRENPTHVFQKPGIYPVKLIVRDGADQDMYIQHITVTGEPDQSPTFEVQASDPSFVKPKTWKTSAYQEVHQIPNTIHFNANPSWRDSIAPKTLRIQLRNGLQWKDDSHYSPLIEPVYKHGGNWLNIDKKVTGNYVDLTLSLKWQEMVHKYGFYEGYVLIQHPAAVNSPAFVRVRVDVSQGEPASRVVVDNHDAQVRRSDFYWLKPRFHYNWSKGHDGDFLIGGGSEKGEFIQYSAELEEGTYEVQLMSPAYVHNVFQGKIASFSVEINSADGKKRIRIRPSDKITSLGTFRFRKGRKGYVRILSHTGKGLVIADAVRFVKTE